MNRLQRQIYAITSIFGGWSPTYEAGSQDQFLFSLGIDTETRISSIRRPSGAIVPVRFTEFSSSELTDSPMWISGAPTSSGVFVYGSSGSVYAYTGATLTGEVGIASLAANYGGAGNGMAVWNDYVYCATASTIARYGRLSQTGPTFQFNYWVDSLAMSALSQPDYPATRSVTFPSHVLLPHTDGRVYVADYDGANGRLHSFTTDSDGGNGSASFNDVTFPPGLMPMCAASLGTDIVIVLSPQAAYASGAIPRPGVSALLAFWDAVPGNAPYRYVPIGEPLATAVKVRNGQIRVWAGNIDTNVKVLRYLGGESFEVEAQVDDGSPPFPGAVDSEGNMDVWGGHVSYPATRAGVFSLGFRSGKLPGGSLNHIGMITGSGSLPVVTAVKFLERGKHPVIGWSSDTLTNFGIDKEGGTSAYQSVIRSSKVNVNRKFKIRRLTFTLSDPLASGMIIEPKFYIDNETDTVATTVVNTTNFAESQRIIDIQDLDIEGQGNFALELNFTGTTEVAVLLPVNVEYEYCD